MTNKIRREYETKGNHHKHHPKEKQISKAQPMYRCRFIPVLGRGRLGEEAPQEHERNRQY
jgi:hypothetical protein